MEYFNFKFKVSTTLWMILLMICQQMPSNWAEIRSRSSANRATEISYRPLRSRERLTSKISESNELSDSLSSMNDVIDHKVNPQAINTDFITQMSWKCANNASCLYALTNSLLTSYKRGDIIRFGYFDIVKLPLSEIQSTAQRSTAKQLAHDWGMEESGRSISKFVEFMGGNAIRIPVGPMMFSVQRATDDANYIEVALLKKTSIKTSQETSDVEGRRGGGGGGGGGGMMMGGGRGGRGKKKEHKEMQLYIPMYLAATAFGWTMLAAKAVALLTLKALTLSKVAFLVAALVFIKKMMEGTAEKMIYHYPEHTPYIMPYSMDYGLHSMSPASIEMATSELYPAAMPLHAAAAAAAGGSAVAAMGATGGSMPMPAQNPMGAMEHMTAESNMHPNSADMQNQTQGMPPPAYNPFSMVQNVKRTDRMFARSEYNNSYQDVDKTPLNVTRRKGKKAHKPKEKDRLVLHLLKKAPGKSLKHSVHKKRGGKVTQGFQPQTYVLSTNILHEEADPFRHFGRILAAVAAEAAVDDELERKQFAKEFGQMSGDYDEEDEIEVDEEDEDEPNNAHKHTKNHGFFYKGLHQ